ncbi:hypothetical protein HDV00_000899 [Rhizophlyctis rosea]|nr:hypothetical protein HDV00_000899 [Rhizophlyctis rosea]
MTYNLPPLPVPEGDLFNWDGARVKKELEAFAEERGLLFKVGDYVGSPSPETRLDMNQLPLKLVMEPMDSGIEQWRLNRPVTSFQNFTPIELPALSRDEYPARLVDLSTNMSVLTSSFPTLVEYTIISHVWGSGLTQLDGEAYGVDWQIPIRDEKKLLEILDGCRAYGRSRYVWVDVLCIPQHASGSNDEVQKMGHYYSNAALCIVWIDDPPILSNPSTHIFIKCINAMFGNTIYGRKTDEALGNMLRGEVAFEIGLNETQAYGLVSLAKIVEEAGWFQRVWTFQEGVLPPFSIFLFGRYGSISRNEWWMLLRTANLILKMGIERSLDFSPLMSATAWCMQESPMWHLQWFAELRKRREVGFWETIQAVQSRGCSIEVDRIYGILGIVPSHLHPEVRYDVGYEELYGRYWRRIVEAGDWSGTVFVNGHVPGNATCCIPSPATSKGGLVVAPQHPRTNKDLTVATVHSDGVKFTEASLHDVEWIWSMIKLGDGEDLCGESQHVLYVDQDKAAAAARAMGLNDEILDGVCVGSMAAFLGMSSLTNPEALSALEQTFPNAAPKVEEESGRALLILRQLTLLYKYAPHAHFAALGLKVPPSDAANPPIAAVVAFEEKPQGPIRILFGTKADGQETTKEGLVLDRRENGMWHKIGVVVFAKEMKARPGTILVAGE